ncbi:MAG TPA: phytanoyl-CoA dioxygenase family protein [Bryobacteraceae bacterium]|nr:phytanoyl-CoA dioxygenase family protein [Bryobacteraceae bacterium]
MPPLPEVTETTSLGVFFLKCYWAQAHALRAGALLPSDPVREKTFLHGLGLGIGETAQFLMHASPSIEEFEQWILARNGGSLEPAHVARLNAALIGQDASDPEIESAPDALSAEDLSHWEDQGYVVLRHAITPEASCATAQAILNSINADLRDPATWYQRRDDATIWVSLVHHSTLHTNRRSLRIRKALAQLWRRNDIWITVDRGGFNPPQTERWRFPGPHLHWDVSLAPPVPFGVQGILYLTDTAAHQGAFRCVSGFHRKLNHWLSALPFDANPRDQNLETLGPVAIAGRAGDLVLWREELPHGASPNLASLPRIVQYITGHPSQWEINPVWR